MKENPKILIRVRPLLKFEDESAWITTSTTIKCMNSKCLKQRITELNHTVSDIELQNYAYNFHKVFDKIITSQKIYKQEIRQVIEKSLKSSVNSTIVAYGQTCSGKTYTLLGIREVPGLIPCILRDLFNGSYQGNYRYAFKISYTEIYNEKLNDLLHPNGNRQMKIVKDNEWGNEIHGATKMQVMNFEQCLQVLERGETNRKYGQKQNHQRSSRSHTLIKIYIERWSQQLVCTRSSINVVDLAGSQRLRMNDQMTKQSGYINKSLFQFSNVISRLSEGSDQHIPYRDSKLTRLLENSLKKNSNLVIIFCVAPAMNNFLQSISTLRIATKAKKIVIENNNCQNVSDKANVKKLCDIIKQKNWEIGNLKKEVQLLNANIEKLEQKMSSMKEKKEKDNQSKMVGVKVLVLFDHQNFMLSINDTVRQVGKQDMININNDLMESLSLLYEDYAKKIVKVALDSGYNENWLKIEDLCFASLLYQKDALLRCRIPILKETCANIEKKQGSFVDILKQYISQMEKKCCNMRIEESPNSIEKDGICQQSRIEHAEVEQKIGSKILGWGCRKDGRVFKNTTFSKTIAVQWNELENVKEVQCGAHHSLVLTTSGEVFGWGKNDYHQITNSTNQVISIPQRILVNVKIKSIAAGWAHSLLLSNDGNIYSFGFGEDGQLGHGNNRSLTEPTKIQFSSQVVLICAGHSHSGFIDCQNNYYAFGFNKDYRLMIAQSKQVNQPKKVNIKGIVKAALGVTHSCLLTKHGKVYCGGVGTNGELGIDLNPTIIGYQTIAVTYKSYEENPIEKVCPIVEVQFFNSHRAIDISCGESSTGVVTEKKELFTFGKTSFGRVGHSQSSIHKILTNVDHVKMGYRHGFAWNEQRKQVYGWGFNMYNQLGTYQLKDLKKPQLIQEISSKEVIKLSCGFFHSVAICK